jgi:hypothetical protein
MSYVEMANRVLWELDGARKQEAKPASPEAYAAEPAEAPEPTQEELDRAGVVLARAGIRLMRIDGVDYAGIWSDLDRPEVRAALRTYGKGRLQVRYLDGNVPMRYKLRRVLGEPVPANVLAAMEQEPSEPWVIRDRMLKEMGWSPDGIPWEEWKARSLNRLFLEQGVLGESGRITAATVRDGERRRT